MAKFLQRCVAAVAFFILIARDVDIYLFHLIRGYRVPNFKLTFARDTLRGPCVDVDAGEQRYIFSVIKINELNIAQV